MTVTKIEEFDKKRVRVFIDCEFAFVLYKGELRLFGLKQDSEIEDTVCGEIIEKVLPKRAKLRCMNLLKTKSYTEKQLSDKLRQGEYTQTVIDEALSYVKSYGYVDDRLYAEDYVQYHREKKSRRALEQTLLKKGIDRDIIAEVFLTEEETNGKFDELSMATEILLKKKYDPQMATNKEKQRLSALLYRKGFAPDIIRSVLLLDITSN